MRKSKLKIKVEAKIDSLTKDLHDFAATSAEVREEMNVIEAQLILLNEIMEDDNDSEG